MFMLLGIAVGFPFGFILGRMLAWREVAGMVSRAQESFVKYRR